MASCSGKSSGSPLLQNSGSERNLQGLMDQRKRNRMQSNRESARRSRMKKQNHLDELMGHVAQLRKENSQIITNTTITTQQYLNLEAENSILRAQVDELSQRLQSLNDILNYMITTTIDDNNNNNHNNGMMMLENDDSFYGPGGPESFNQQPIMATVDVFQY